jgi:3'-phosphoadenosine 5'-phosphosulfate sulfotransferase (PAPS reductase)/FAD synthetase
MQNWPATPEQMLDAGALFVVSHSAGKDSQAMLIKLRQMCIPDSQMLIVHADLGDVEWRGNMDHIRRYAGSIPIVCAVAKTSFWDMVERRQMFPSPSQRQCTSDLKRGPINREVRRYLKTHPEFDGRVVMCMGLRADESPARAKKKAMTYSNSNSKAGRTWFEWLPILNMKTIEVFETIWGAGQEPHWAYGKGMSRLSCCFCIMANKSDLTIAARENPELYKRYVQTEKRIGHTLSMSRKPLEEITGVLAA